LDRQAEAVRLSALIILYFHPLYILVIKILSSIHVSSAPIILYISYSISTTNNEPTCHPLHLSLLPLLSPLSFPHRIPHGFRVEDLDGGPLRGDDRRWATVFSGGT
jgi:hypothetical protein